MYDCMVHRTPGPSLDLMGATVPIPCTTLPLCVELQLGLVCVAPLCGVSPVHCQYIVCTFA